MKKILYIFTLVFTAAAGTLPAQTVGPTEGAELLQVTPREKMFVHYNSSVLFPGEYLYYKIYNLKAPTNTLSDISKVAYLEMLGGNGELVFKHLIPLENGQGHGDFFIPTTLPSGSYKLLGYTNWMRNNKNIFEADLVVINPYRGDQTAFTPPTNNFDPTGLFISPDQLTAANPRNSTNPSFSLNLNKKLFQNREKVQFKFKQLGTSTIPGSYSISVRKLDSIRNPLKPNSANLSEVSVGPKQRGDVYLPEFRGNLISGSIAPTPSGAGRSLANVKIAFSVPGENLLYKVATTNEEGIFYLSFDEQRTIPELLVEIIGKDRDFFKVELDKAPALDYSDLEFAEFFITPAMEQWILDRSIQNQIENAYYNQKPDTIITSQLNNPFYVHTPELYPLDAYNRFPTIKETFVEIIQSSWIGKNREGEEIIVVREPNAGRNFGLPALLLVDGVMIQDHSSFISYPAKKVKSIGILRDNFYIGSHIFEGIIDVRTFDGKFWQEIPQKHLLQKELKVPEPQKLYFHQTYSDSTRFSTDHIPDLRTQLLWEPKVQLIAGEEAIFEFYTSDVQGIYQIEIEGFTAEGAPVSLKSHFWVEEGVF